MLLYQFFPHDGALAALRSKRLRISRLDGLNDPFEFFCVDLSSRTMRLALNKAKTQLSKNRGLLCFCKSWQNPVMWSHYAQKHQGICMGFEVSAEIHPVTYIGDRLRWPNKLDEEFMKKLLFTKFSHWSYEEEYRVYANIDTPEDGHYYIPFSENLQLRRVLIGCNSSITCHQLNEVIGKPRDAVEVIKVRPAFRTFSIVKQKRGRAWA